MRTKEEIRNNLISLDKVEKIKVWNKYCDESDDHIGRLKIYLNTRRNVERLAKRYAQDIEDVLWGDSYDRRDEYVGYDYERGVFSYKEEDAFAYADVELRTTLTDAVYEGQKEAVAIYEELFPTKEEAKDSEESNETNTEFYQSISYVNDNGKVSLKVSHLNDKGEIETKEYTDKDINEFVEEQQKEAKNAFKNLFKESFEMPFALSYLNLF